jgi:hypothetical protein
MAPQIAPPAKGMTARDYYNQLTSQGMRPYDAYKAVEASFGPPPTPEERAADQASADQKAQLAQTGGTIGGLLLGKEALAGFPTIGKLFGAGAGATTAGAAGTAGTTVATPTLLGAKVVGAGGAGGAATGTGASLAGIGSVALPVAIGAAALSNAWETGMKDILRGRGNRADWANQGVNLATGFIPNTVLRLMGKPSIGRMMTSGKSDAQLLRDDFRGKLKETGVADEDYNITLASGEKYNIGKDGKSKLTNVDGKTTRRTWDVDWENPLAKYAVDKIDPRVRSVYTEEAAKAGIPVEQYTGMLVNAATSNAKNEKDVDANINAFLGKSGLDKGAGATISPKGPAKVTPTVGPITKPQTQVVTQPQEQKKLSFWDMLNSKVNQ